MLQVSVKLCMFQMSVELCVLQVSMKDHDAENLKNKSHL